MCIRDSPYVTEAHPGARKAVDALTEREYKNTSETDITKKRYKGITIEPLNYWPDDLIVATLCSCLLYPSRCV